MKEPKETIVAWSPKYNVVVTADLDDFKKGDRVALGLDDLQLANFLGKNGYPFGFCGNCGDVNFKLSDEIMENIIIEKEFSTVTTITETYDLKDFM